MQPKLQNPEGVKYLNIDPAIGFYITPLGF